MSNFVAALQMEIPLLGNACYTDSKVALHWIKGTKREWKPFVENRVREIRRLSMTLDWRHCRGRENPADIPSRGISFKELKKSSLWRYGPEWLKDTLSDDGDDVTAMPDECIKEMRKRDKDSVHNMLVGGSARNVNLEKIMSCKDFSSLDRLLTTTALVLKFVKILRFRMKKSGNHPGIELTAADRTEAERLWLLDSQQQLENQPNFEVWKKQFGLFVDNDGLYRCGGRLTNADLGYTTCHPVLLLTQHYLTSLIVKCAHEHVMHNGV